MCYACEASIDFTNAIEDWAKSGLPYRKIEVLARPSAIADPNTYVFIFKDALVIHGISRDVFLDIHYDGNSITPGARRKAFGGLWIAGIKNQAMKPQQHGGELRRQLEAEMPSNAPGAVDGVWGQGQPMPVNVTLRTGTEKDLYPLTGWGNSTPPKSQ